MGRRDGVGCGTRFWFHLERLDGKQVQDVATMEEMLAVLRRKSFLEERSSSTTRRCCEN